MLTSDKDDAYQNMKVYLFDKRKERGYLYQQMRPKRYGLDKHMWLLFPSPRKGGKEKILYKTFAVML